MALNSILSITRTFWNTISRHLTHAQGKVPNFVSDSTQDGDGVGKEADVKIVGVKRA